ncbi:hypothetical protein ACVD14_23980 [Escherichia coli]
MGTYIEICAEIKTPTGWEFLSEDIFLQPEGYKEQPDSSPFSYKHYGMFAFQSGVRITIGVLCWQFPAAFRRKFRKRHYCLSSQ